MQQSPQPPEGLMTFQEALGRYPISRTHLVFCILTGEIKTKKIGKRLYIDRDSINHFFETRWEARKESVKEEILNFRHRHARLHDKHRKPAETNKLFDDMVHLVHDIADQVTPKKEAVLPQKPATADPARLKEKIASSTRAISDAFKSFLEMLTESRHKMKK